ncbi:EpsG family protein [Flavobacterium agrisoli]|uniref:EpsG family protein n=1 Tax=Flavobacterium agrisoli TaxID=2793066 RepID=A0A934PN38_9FLAO|nr:EpsG family protein [Flavobacterium agrisoli]MBK0371262.1 EpsG family protein [Flavobacterium agrisoli]
MIFYILLLLGAFVLVFISYKQPCLEKQVSFSLLGIMMVVGGFRDHIGWDYNAYVHWYLYGTRDQDFEFGFLALLQFFRYFKIDYRFLFFFFSFFTYLFAYLGIREYTKKTSLPLLLYLVIPVFFLYSFTYVRQFLAVTIAFYAFSFLLKKQYWSYFLLMFLGISVHKSCLIPLVFFLLIYKWGECINQYYIVLLMGLSFVISKIGLIYLLSLLLKDSHYLFYVSSQFAVPVPWTKLIGLNAMGLIVLIWYHMYGFQVAHQKILVMLYLFSVIIINLFSESTELTRVYIYFRIFEIIIVAEIIRNSLKRKHLYLITFLSCFYIVPFFRAIKIDSEYGPEKLKLIPYKSYLVG